MSSANGNTAEFAVSQCIASLAGNAYSFGVEIKPNSANVFGMGCSAHSSADCSGAALGIAVADDGAADSNGWVPLRTATPFVLPAGTQSVSCAITATQPPPQATTSRPDGLLGALWADKAFFAPGTTPVTLQSFDID